MKDYTIFADSACDLNRFDSAKRNIKSIPLTLRFDGSCKQYNDGELNAEVFYHRLRSGETAKTSAVNAQAFENEFKKELAIGRDILYIGLSSALSGTYSSADVAARKLRKKFPENKIITIDSLSASAGIALLIDLVLKKKAEGATIEEAKDFVERTKLNICHLFTIDDAAFLVKSGRVKPSKAFLGNMLGIKPILKVDESGKLVATGRVRGRHQAILTLATKCKNYCNSELKYAYISHGDCPGDAEILKNTLEEYNIKTKLITNVGAVIGAHSGPDTLALFFLGDTR